MIHFVADQFIAPLFRVDLFHFSENKVTEAALPVLSCLGLILLAVFPIPSNTLLLAAAVMVAVYFYEPPLGEPFVLPKLKPLFSPAAFILT